MRFSNRRRFDLAFAALFAGVFTSLAGTARVADAKEERRALGVDDFFAIGKVDDPRVSPDGRWIAYAVTTQDLGDDEARSRIWMVPMGGGDAIPLTAEGRDSSFPRWSPDGRYLAFLSARGDDEGADEEKGDARKQVWTLFREGGEAAQVTDTPQSVDFFQWSPDGRRMLLVLQDPKPEEIQAHEARKKGEKFEKPKTPPPAVVTRRQFKQDYVGYLDSRRRHLYVLDLATKKLRQITSGDTDDQCQIYVGGCPSTEPAWSPDGKRIAFVSNRTEDPDANYNTDIWVVDADNDDRGARLVQVTTHPGPDVAPSWSPDGRLIAHASNLETDKALYATFHLAVSPSTGGETKWLTRELDRMVFRPRFSTRGDEILFLLEDSGEQSLARIPASGGAFLRLIGGPRAVGAFHESASGAIAAVVSEPHLPGEVFLLAEGKLEQRSHVNDALLASLRLGAVEDFRYPSADGTEIEAFVVKPPDFSARRRYPTILLLHGGPQAQYDASFQFEAQLFAANGYVVLLPNPRGSTGYGQDFCLAIWQAWGERDTEDVLAAVDHAVEQGWTDPERLGVTGWSYGGMLTNHVITKTDRFGAAATGASAALYVLNYGHDHYQRWWTFELGNPWEPESRELYERISPFNRVDRVSTPTLILGGAQDWNVPIANSEQLYQALRVRGVPTELVVYPGEFHGIDTPSHAKDLYERLLAWFDRYLKGGGAERGR